MTSHSQSRELSPAPVQLLLFIGLAFFSLITFQETFAFGVLTVALSAAAGLAALLGWGWLVPGLVIGISFGIFLDSGAMGGPASPGIDHTIRSIAIGTILGVSVGFLCDLPTLLRRNQGANQPPAEQSEDQQP